jgi:ATP adenylyltransferase
MRYLSAPWRADYVRRATTMTGCVFCEAVKSRGDRAPAVLYRGRRNIVMLNKYPYTPGHLMIAPRRHVADFVAARADERAELAELLQVALRVLAAAYGPHGFNVGMNRGASIGGTRVFIEDLDTTYQRLRPLFDDEKRRRERGRRPRRRPASPSR